MTIGEKIQLCRKGLEMSQEDLAQKLHVSRQTISLWETDQTVPTIDNLIRLKAIFGVSIDEILTNEANQAVDEPGLKESYRFSFDINELMWICRMQKKRIYKRPIITSIICISGFLSVAASGLTFPWNGVGLGIFVGVFIVNLLAFIKELRVYNKYCENTIPSVASAIYEYQLYDEFINVNVYRNDERIRQVKCYYRDIEKVSQYENWLFFQISGQSYIARRSQLIENSMFFAYMFKNPEKTVVHKAPSKLRTLSIVLFIASLLSIFSGIMLWGLLMQANGLMQENMWTFFLMTPIPISSIILGFILRAKGYKYKKNIIAGFIMTFFLCIYGSFVFMV